MSLRPYSLEQGCLKLNGERVLGRIAMDHASYDPQFHIAAMITVDLSLNSSLEFAKVRHQVSALQAERGLIVWDLDLDIKPPFNFEGIFNAHYQALKIFTEQLLIPFQKETLGCSLFQGECVLNFPWNKGDYQNFLEWLTDLYRTPEHLFEAPLGEAPLGDLKNFHELSLEMFDVTPFCRHLKNIHSMNTYAAYLHRLAAALPEELFVFVCLDARYITHPAYLYQMLSKERFSHLHLAVKGAAIPLDALVWKEDEIYSNPQETAVGVCFPNDPYCLQNLLHEFKKALFELNKRGIAYRIIPEFLMTSSWDGIDDIVFMNKALSPQGKRILQGFSITGGRLIYLDTPVGFENETPFAAFLADTSSHPMERQEVT